MINTNDTFTGKKPSRLLFWGAALALLTGLTLSVLSWLELCVEHCSANQDYRLFGFPFAFVGIPFFTLIFFTHLFSRRFPALSKWVGWMIATSLGAEAMFLYVQHYQIGRFCPVCLSIFFSLFVAGLFYIADYVQSLLTTIQQRSTGDIMKKIGTGFTTAPFFIFGFILAFFGVTKFDPVEAAEVEIKNKITFGMAGSPVEVYFVSDWFCPSCRKLEFMIEKLLPEIQSEVAFYFIDYPIHQKSLNFTPYNLAFMINDKPEYFKARHILFALTEDTSNPTDEQVKKAAEAEHITFKEISFVEIKTGLDFFEKVVKKFKLNSTPSVVITNVKKNKTVKLEGTSQVTEDNILKGIATVKKAK